jgi:tRNA (guanine-N7-)-methyltransferase
MQFITDFFQEAEVSEVWVTFPDPRPKSRDEKRRLTYFDRIKDYRHILTNDGWFRLKTDNTGLFEYTLEVLNSEEIKSKNLEFSYDLYESELASDCYGIKTRYEEIFTAKGEKIKYLKCQFI